MLAAIFDTFVQIFSWLRSSLGMVMHTFYTTEGGLTFFGTLSLVALGISIFFLLMRVVQNFLHFRG